MIEKTEKWVIKRRGGAMEEMVSKLGITPAFARILCGRGYDTAEKAAAFLYPESAELVAAEALPDAEKFCFFISKAKAEKQKVRIIGDYDADGVTATYLMLFGLQEFGIQADYRIPNRITDGYGISMAMVKEAEADGIGVLITVDNGIVACEQTEYAKNSGMTVLITDHHEPQDTLPKADAIVDFKIKEEYSGSPVCGAVVAAKLMDLLLKDIAPNFFRRNIEIVALATVADVMSLTEENRIIVKEGLLKPMERWNTGLQKLAECNALKTKPSAYTLGFVFAPCMNAMGRLSIADPGVELLLETDALKAETIAAKMVDANSVRKDMTVNAVEAAIKELDRSEDNERLPIVYMSEDCHESIAGIVAGKLREKYYLPSIVLCRSSEDPTLLKGSGRSIEEYSIFEGLMECSDLLVKFGGHSQACGLSIREENLAAFRQRLGEHFHNSGVSSDEKVLIDLVVNFSDISEKLISEIDRMEPFGNGNKRPVFATRNARIVRISHFGRTTKYTRIIFEDQLGSRLSAVYFGNADRFIDCLTESYGATAIQNMYKGEGESLMHIVYAPKVSDYSHEIELTLERFQAVTV